MELIDYSNDEQRMEDKTTIGTFKDIENHQEDNEEFLEEEIENVDLEESEEEDEAIVKDILDSLKTRQDSKDSDDSGYLDDLFEIINEPDPNDVIVKDKLALLEKTERSIELQNLGLERLNANLFKGFCAVEYLYLQNNKIASLAYDFFPVLDRLKYLDLRNNRLVTLPCSICYHDHLEVLLLQNNCIQRAPKELGSLPRLRAIQISQNPLRYPAPSVVRQGPRGILEFLREEWRRYESSAALARVRHHDAGGAGDVRITAKVETTRDEKTETSQNSADSKRNNRKSLTKSTPKLNSATDSAFSSGGATECPVKYENINYKDSTVCMYVSKIRPKKLKKSICLPSCTEENKDTTSQTSSHASHCTKPPSNQSAPSTTSVTKRRQKKLQHYSEILNPYSPLRSCSEPLDDGRTQAMYLRNLVEIHRKFIASTRDRTLQRMKNKEVLSEWRDEYRAKCSRELSQSTKSERNKTKALPFAVYKEFEKMMTRRELAVSQVEEKAMRPKVRESATVEDQERYMESKMADLQTSFSKIDFSLNSSSLKSNESSKGLETCAEGPENNLNADQDCHRNVTHSEQKGGRERQNYLLQQICMMQELRSQIKSLTKLNDAIV